MSTEHDGSDGRDPLKAATDEWRSQPRDIVPKTRYAGDNSDLAALNGETVTVTYYEITEHGVVKRTECLPVAISSFKQ